MRSRDRILTTHVGSLPRPQSVVDVLFAQDRGELADEDLFDRTMREAVRDVVARQRTAGIDIVSDGEMSKISYATYIRHRFTGFAPGEVPRAVPADLDDFPEYRDRLAREGATPRYVRPVCKGPIAVKDVGPLERDIARFRDALAGAGAAAAFMTAASPGVIAVFQPNEYYPSREAYLQALAEALKSEYETIVQAGFLLQVDCPDLAMGRHIQFRDASDEEFLRNAEMQVEALNYALADVPAGSVRMHLCWGNYEGPHTHDIPLQRVLPVVLKAKPAAIAFEASNPRHAHEWMAWREADIPEDKVLIPGVLDSVSNFVEHPQLVANRILQFTAIVGRERVIAGTDCGFGTFAGFGKIHPDICYAKLTSLAEGAALASEQLW
ncbi:MAG: cobalamin-independent methionine synthase II family protein [Chloroflexi bacterium]|nr:cobalamin-independent methionine synthase II family protein [Chloroflexota bacterium]